MAVVALEPDALAQATGMPYLHSSKPHFPLQAREAPPACATPYSKER